MAIDLVARLSLEDNLSGPLAAINSKMAGMVGFAAVAAGATSAVKSFADFESQVRKATVIAGGSDKEFAQMTEGIKEMSSETSVSATKIAEGMTELASAGMNTTDALAAMPGILTAAKASAEDLAVTSDVVTSALSIWGLEAEESARIADVLAQAANETKLGIADMGMALKYAGAPAKALGMSLEEVSAAAGIVVNAGIDSSTAGTSLRAGLLSLTAPTKAAAAAMSKYGFSAVDANGNVKSMVDIVDNLKGSMEGMTAAQQAAYLKTLVGTESYSAFMSLIDAGPEKISKLQKSFENSEGASKKAADEMSKGLGAALEAAKTSLELFKYDVGDALAPAVETFARFIAETDFSPMVAQINSLASVASSVATVVVNNFDKIAMAVKVVLGLFLATKAMSAVVGVFNGIVSVVNLTIGVFNKLKAAFEIAKTVFLVVRGIFMMFPGMWLVTAIGAVIAAGVLLYKNWDTVKAKALALWEDIKSGNSAFSFLTPVIQGAINAFNWLKDTFNTVKDYAAETWQRILDGKSSVLLLLGPLGWLVQAGVELYRNWDTIKGAAMKLWGELKSGERSFASVLGPIGVLIDAGVSLYKNWDRIKAGAIALWNKIEMGKGVFALLKVAMIPVKLAIAVLVGVFNLLKTGVVAVWNVFNRQGPAQLIRNSLKNVMEVAHKVKSAFTALKEGVSYAMEKAKAAVFSSVNGIIEKVNWLIEKLNAIPGVNVPLVANVSYSGPEPGEMSAVNVRNDGPQMIGHHGGWNEIRTDRTPRLLHAGERVLTAVENDSYKQMMSSGLPNAIARMASLKQTPISNATSMNNVDNRMTSNVSNTNNTYSTTNDSVTKNYTTGAFELPAFNEVPIINAIRNLSNAAGTAPIQESFKLDVTDIVTAIERMAKRAINVVIPQDGSANAVEQLRNIIAGNQPTLTATETQAVSNSVQNSSFSESVSNVTTTNNSKKTTTQTIQPVVNLGGVHIDSKWDLDTMAGREQVAKKIALPITQEIAGLLKLYV